MFRIKSSIGSWVSNIRYFVFNMLDLCIIYIFLTTSCFTTFLSLLKWTEAGNNLSTCNLSSLLFKLFKLLGAFLNLSISNLSTLDFKLAKSTF